MVIGLFISNITTIGFNNVVLKYICFFITCCSIYEYINVGPYIFGSRYWLMKVHLSFIIPFTFFLSVSNSVNSQLQKIYLNPQSNSNGKQSSFVDSIRFIPLETERKVILPEYFELEVTPQLFLVKDYTNGKLLIYSRQGSFLKEIDYKKKAENFYPVYQQQKNQVVFFGNNKNFLLNKRDNLVIRLNWKNPRNRKYFRKYIIDLSDTSFTVKKVAPGESDIMNAFSFYGDFYWQGQIETSSLYKDSLGYEIRIYKNSEPVKAFFPYNRINEPRFLYTQESSFYSKTDTSYIHTITRPFCDTIYKLVNDSLFPAYQLVLPLENSLPPTFFTKPFKNKTERENFNQNNGWLLHQVYNFYETTSSILLLVQYLNNLEFYIYQKNTNTTFKTKNIRPDSSQYNLQLLTDFNLIKSGNRFYKAFTVGRLVTYFDQNKGILPPKELEDFLKRKPDNATPVVVEFKLKN